MEAITPPLATNGSGTPDRTPTPERGGTEYVILKRVEAGGAEAWSVCGRETSPAGRDAAIRAGVTDDGAYKAVPLRSWSGGLELSVETVRRTSAKPLDD